jgi:hypothetical protein
MIFSKKVEFPGICDLSLVRVGLDTLTLTEAVFGMSYCLLTFQGGQCKFI